MGVSPVNLMHIFITPFYKNTSRGLLLKEVCLFTFEGPLVCHVVFEVSLLSLNLSEAVSRRCSVKKVILKAVQLFSC